MEQLTEMIKNKYPSRAKNGIRYIEDKGKFYEVMFEGGETLYLSK